MEQRDDEYFEDFSISEPQEKPEYSEYRTTKALKLEDLRDISEDLAMEIKNFVILQNCYDQILIKSDQIVMPMKIQYRNREQIHKLLQKCRELKSLIIFEDSAMFTDDYDFKLEELAVAANVMCNSIKFLKSQAKTLKRLSLNVKSMSSGEIEWILRTLSLEDLELNVKYLSDDISIKVHENTSIKELVLHFIDSYTRSSYKVTPKLIRACKNLTSLSIFGTFIDFDDLFPTIEPFLQHLTTLNLETVPSCVSSAANLTNLKHLTISTTHKLDDIINLAFFIANCPKLVTLCVVHCKTIVETLLHLFLNFDSKVRPQYIHFGGLMEFKTASIAVNVYNSRFAENFQEITFASCELSRSVLESVEVRSQNATGSEIYGHHFERVLEFRERVKENSRLERLRREAEREFYGNFSERPKFETEEDRLDYFLSLQKWAEFKPSKIF